MIIDRRTMFLMKLCRNLAQMQDHEERDRIIEDHPDALLIRVTVKAMQSAS